MPTIAFWNIGGIESPGRVAALARNSDVDVLVLAECKLPIVGLLRALNAGEERLFFSDQGNSARLVIFTRFQTDASVLIRDSSYVAIRHYRMPIGDTFLLVAVHLPSKLRNKTEDQTLGSTRVAGFVRDAERNVGHARTVIIGDLNMNPFEAGVVGAGGLHAVMDRRIAAKGSRTVHGEVYDYFYNPMWAHFGDAGSTPPGTYYYNSSNEVNYFWNIFDQVLIRPALLSCLSNDGVNVVTELEGESLLDDRGRPDREIGSDHLPVVVNLNVIEEPYNGIEEHVGRPQQARSGSHSEGNSARTGRLPDEGN